MEPVTPSIDPNILEIAQPMPSMEPVIYHKHTGPDSPRIDYDDIENTPPRTIFITTNFDDNGRYDRSINSTGSAGVTTNGAFVASGNGAGGYGLFNWLLAPTSAIALFARRPAFDCLVYANSIDTSNGQGDAYFGIAECSTGSAGITFSQEHIGFKIVKSSGTARLYATQADGTAEVESLITIVSSSDILELALQVVDAVTVKYYWSLNGSEWATVTLKGFVPTSNTRVISFASTNRNTAYNFDFNIMSASYRR